ncbi:hypothetical protein [Sphingobacterium siyangense]|uniref:hypothetical protein n=1 Tax=Sphingobacterium siyangense TaxID=459529 RepID=UPI002FDAF1DD
MSSTENKIFKDPGGKYSLKIPKQWKLHKKSPTDRKNLHQFETGNSCIFQISCNQITDHIAGLIKENNIIPHDFSLPNISFIEKYVEQQDVVLYHWMAVIGDYFFMAIYFFGREIINKNLGLDLMNIRLLLRNINLSNNHSCFKKSLKRPALESDFDFSDIGFWKYPMIKFLTDLNSKDQKHIRLESSLKIDPLKLYTLLTLKISQQPNGFFDLVKVRKPLDNPIWWDFVLECPKGYIQIWRTPFVIEAKYHFDGEIDLESFFNSNIDRYKDEIEKGIKNFDKHTLYINHYQSYLQCVNTLWKEVSEIDLTLPETSKNHRSSETDMEKYSKDLDQFLKNSVRYHALAKSLVLNAAFKIESFLNLIIRIGSIPEMRLYPDVLSKFTKQDFQSRVKNIRFYTQILSSDIDMGGDVYRNTKELMTLRNKYVYYEEDAVHNKLGEIYYDRDYPLHPLQENRPAIESIKHTFHHPDFSTVRKAYETSNSFVEMIEELFHKEIKQSLLNLIQQNPIGYNETKGMYSAIHMPIALDFFTGE